MAQSFHQKMNSQKSWVLAGVPVREAMRLLEEGGFIRREQGIETIICRNETLINSTLEINAGVSEMIQGKGMKPGSLITTIRQISASKELAAQLTFDIGAPVTSLSRIRTAAISSLSKEKVKLEDIRNEKCFHSGA